MILPLKAYIKLQNGIEVEALTTLYPTNGNSEKYIALCGYRSGNVGTKVVDGVSHKLFYGHEPSKYNATTITVVTTQESVDGVILPTIKRTGVAKIEVDWTYLSAQAWANILTFFEENFVFNAIFFNQTTNDYSIREMYVGDRTSGMFMRDVDGTIKGFTDCHLSLIDTRRRDTTECGWSIE